MFAVGKFVKKIRDRLMNNDDIIYRYDSGAFVEFGYYGIVMVLILIILRVIW